MHIFSMGVAGLICLSGYLFFKIKMIENIINDVSQKINLLDEEGENWRNRNFS